MTPALIGVVGEHGPNPIYTGPPVVLSNQAPAGSFLALVNLKSGFVAAPFEAPTTSIHFRDVVSVAVNGSEYVLVVGDNSSNADVILDQQTYPAGGFVMLFKLQAGPPIVQWIKSTGGVNSHVLTVSEAVDNVVMIGGSYSGSFSVDGNGPISGSGAFVARLALFEASGNVELVWTLAGANATASVKDVAFVGTTSLNQTGQAFIAGGSLVSNGAPPTVTCYKNGGSTNFDLQTAPTGTFALTADLPTNFGGDLDHTQLTVLQDACNTAPVEDVAVGIASKSANGPNVRRLATSFTGSTFNADIYTNNNKSSTSGMLAGYGTSASAFSLDLSGIENSAAPLAYPSVASNADARVSAMALRGNDVIFAGTMAGSSLASSAAPSQCDLVSGGLHTATGNTGAFAARQTLSGEGEELSFTTLTNANPLRVSGAALGLPDVNNETKVGFGGAFSEGFSVAGSSTPLMATHGGFVLIWTYAAKAALQ
jgi:hypothetical protein